MNFKKIFWGLFFILAGTFVIINQLGIYTNINLFTLILSIFLLAIFVKGIMKVNFPEILFSLAIGAILYAKELNIENLTPWPVLLAALLGSVGLSIIFSRSGKIYAHHKRNFDKVINDSDTNVSTKFSSTIKYVNSEDFKEGNIDCSFGEVKMYLDKAIIVGDKATLNINVSFGSVELFVPKDWKIVSNVHCMFGGLEEKNSKSDLTTKELILKGDASFAGVEITYI